MKENKPEVTLISINKINTEHAIRRNINEVALSELVESVKDVGIMQPILVRKSAEKKDVYDLIAGLRRLKSAKNSQLKVIPCIIRENVDDKELLELMLTENLKREELNPFDEALGYVRLMNDFKLSVTQISRRLKIPTTRIEDKIRLLDCCEKVQKYVFDGKLDLRTAYALADRPENEQIELAELAIEHNLSTESLLNFVHHKTGKKSKNVDKNIRRSSPLKINACLMGYVKFLKSLHDNMQHIPEKEAVNILATIDEISNLCHKIKKIPK